MRLIAKHIRRFTPDKRGQIAVIFAISLPILVGFCGLGSDVLYWYMQSRQLQSAADIAAYDAAIALKSNPSSATVVSEATAGAQANGWTAGTIQVNSPPSSGSHQNAQSVEVILGENVPRFFTGIFSNNSTISISARAVVTLNGWGGACVLALSPSGAGAITVTGNGVITASGCDVVANSSSSTAILMSGSNATITTPCLVTVGQSSTTSGLHLSKCSTATQNASAATDPYASVPAPSIPGSCITPSGSTYSPGYYCSGLSVTGNATFAPGTYYVNGNLSISSSGTVTGSGVTFYVTGGGAVSISGSGTVTLSAPTSGTYAGMVFFADRSGASSITNSISGGTNLTVTGAMYFPSEAASFSGGSSGGQNCTQLIAYTVNITGAGYLKGACPGDGMTTVNVADAGGSQATKVVE